MENKMLIVLVLFIALSYMVPAMNVNIPLEDITTTSLSLNETDPKAYNGTLAYSNSTQIVEFGGVTIEGDGADGPVRLALDQVSTRIGQIEFKENGTQKWAIRSDGSGTGSNLKILRFNPSTGSLVSTPITISSSTGEISLDNSLNVAQTLQVTGAIYSGSSGIMSSGTISSPSMSAGSITASKSYITTSDPEMEVFSITNWTNILILDTDVPFEKKGCSIFFDGENTIAWNSLNGDWWYSGQCGELSNKRKSDGNIKSLGYLKENYHLDYGTRTFYYQTKEQEKTKNKVYVPIYEAVKTKNEK